MSSQKDSRKPFKEGQQVRIIRADCGFVKDKPICGMTGTITKIDGGYYIVRPLYQHFVTELYESEIAHLDESWWGEKLSKWEFLQRVKKSTD